VVKFCGGGFQVERLGRASGTGLESHCLPGVWSSGGVGLFLVCSLLGWFCSQSILRFLFTLGSISIVNDERYIADSLPHT
jgi:hypothetical protein